MHIRHRDRWHPWHRHMPARHPHRGHVIHGLALRRTWQAWALWKSRLMRRAQRRQLRRAMKRRNR